MSQPGADLRRRTLRSLYWQLLGVGGQRIVQLTSQVVLARLLLPEDIGLFVIVLSGIGVVESLTLFLGEQATMSSERAADRHYLDTVFTVRFVRGLLISSLLCGLAWPLAWYFADGEIETRYWLPGLFLTLAGNGLIDSLQSPARAARMKGLEFHRVVAGDFAASVLSLALTVGLALLWRDVWALLIAHLGGTTIRVAISYVAAPHRPRLHVERDVFRELMAYGRQSAGTPFLLLMVFCAPAFVLGKLAGMGAVAVFDFAGRLARLPEDVFLRVLAPVAVPAYAQLRSDLPRLARAWTRAVHAFLLVGTPMSVALAWCGDALPSVVFGPKYGSISGLFALLALHGGLAGLTAVVGPVFWAVGQPQWDRKAQFFRCVTIYALGVPAAIWGGTTAFAAASCVAIGTALAFSLLHALPILGLRLRDLAQVTRDGIMLGAGLLGALVVVDLAAAPTGWWRILASGALGGPLLAFLLVRILRGRRGAPPPDVPMPEFDNAL